ncbi:hypothetical protein BC938DRAFT_473639 [Jimgerdemannia flammicorona]|uniref:Uncharacterized protein n=1 Tax=Jimgerdemannia flammicorona TaxID=994334 RepID=A0A433QT56_9FUNG|nr:hypothetical protein BC938DRAFT_473639 [Jimgerdemannia flammicorona]
MDYLLNAADHLVLDAVYATLFPLATNATTTTTASAFLSSLPRDNDLRIWLSLFVLVSLGGWIFYFALASVSYFLFYDKEQMKHPRFLKDQIKLEIICASTAIPGFTILTVPFFWLELKGYSRLYEDPAEYGYVYLALSVAMFLFFTDMGIYFIHRAEHHPSIYKRVHKV